MKFVHPEFLYFMLPPLFILFGLLLTQKESVATFFSDEVMQKLRVESKGLTLKARNALFFLASIMIVVALAEPVYVHGKTKINTKSADIFIALDISNSMLAQDRYPNRLAFAKKKALDFIAGLKEDRVGVIAFAKASYLVSPLSFDKEAVAFLLKNLDTSSLTEQGTDFYALLQTVVKSSQNKKKYVVIFSDGGDREDFSKEIAFAKKNGITIFVLGVGTQKGSPIPLSNGEFMHYKGELVITKLNSKISQLATKSGGVYIEATNSNRDIEALLAEVSSIVAKKELKDEYIENRIPLFYFPLGLAMLLVLIALSSMTKRVRVEVPSLFLVAFLLFFTTSSYAGLLDFRDIQAAKNAYEEGYYKEAAKRFEAYAKSTHKATAYYNAANSYYKAKEYKKAIANYKKVQTEDHHLMAKALANLGNAYAKSGNLEAAMDAYKRSLKLIDDKEVRENLEEVKKHLKRKKEQKKDQQKQNKKQNQQKKSQNSRDSQNSKNSKNSKKSQDSQNSKNSKNSKKSQDSQKRKQQANSNKKEQQQNKNNKKEADEKKVSHKQKEQKKEDKSQVKTLKQNQEKKMSDAEERKWLEEINKDTKTFLYRLHAPTQKRNSDEKPW